MRRKVFFTFNLLLSFSSSKADIPDCNYYDTVDLSHVEKQNGSYEYEGIVIPANLTGEYDFKMIPYGGRQPETKHLRGCVCQVKPCIRFCCPRNKMLPNGGCSDGFEEELSRSNPYLNVTFEDDSIETRYINNQTIMRTQYFECDEMLGLRAGEYAIFENGTIYIKSFSSYLNIEEYCFYPHSGFQETLWIVLHHCSGVWTKDVQTPVMVSIVCLILTSAIYLYVKELRNVLGKCLVSSFLCIIIEYIFLLLEKSSLLNDVCSLVG
ncbi:probable G-protein coupled receptor Mth-like 6 [Drosophila eugracilis]|uniref:probable G-protein coupled receptor Mth-like 6 n=1 Tax=Drosophila eugracilis TaxID=29029 RepID=UPI001BD9FF46|nr:probable G-protein coupled receptor Mth-like 6 [Drosophila eugracilis]